jgi:hypothetical protein
MIVSTVVVLPLVVGWAAPRLVLHDPRATARIIRERYDHSPLAFYGPNLSLPLCYNLRETIPATHNPADLLALLAERPNLVVIAQEKSGRTPDAPPPPFKPDGEPLIGDDQSMSFYRAP